MNFIRSVFATAFILTLAFSALADEKEYPSYYKVATRYSNQKEEQKKIGIFWNSKVKLWKSGDLDIRVEENIFQDKVHSANNYDEFIARAILLIKW